MGTSLILPYWDRQEAADKAFALLDKHYAGMPDFEVVVVDDGNAVPFRVPRCKLNVQVVLLPKKDKPTPQSKAWNAGVKAASYDVVVLSCIEVLHDKPVLQEMRKALQTEDDYLLAATYCPELKEWQCKSDKRWFDLPEGIGPAFLGMLHKSLFHRAGGFDEAYHEGAGYEDRDFARRILKAGGRPVIRDDLAVTHPKACASIAWPAEGFARNEMLYRRKWELDEPINIVCLKAGKAYGAEYVNILFDMVRRNLKAGYPGMFHCITDDPEGLAEGINVIPLPDDLETWYGKLYMFKRGLFPDGSRCLFFDLDTLILGDIEFLVKYDGQFATLRDFYYPQQVGPAIIAWEAGDFASSIWEEWESQGKPRHPMGDLWWLNNLDQGRFVKEIDILQDKFPGKFCSFKADCHPYPPKGTAVVCFHGQPRPDNCGEEWVSHTWKVGGTGASELEVICNTASEKIRKNIISACQRDIPWLEIVSPHERQAVIVGGGPSANNTFPEIAYRKSLGQVIFACNGAAGWLNERGITPDYQVVIDARPENAKFLTAGSKAQFIASQCDPKVFDTASNPILFNLNTEGIADILPQDREIHLISSGTTVGLAALVLAYTQGYRAIHLHGFDSSYDENHHAYSQPENDQDQTVNVVVQGQSFKAATWMVKQAQQFQELALQLADADCVITVAGDGLIPFIAKCMSSTGAK